MAVLSQISCFGERKVVLFQILLDGSIHKEIYIVPKIIVTRRFGSLLAAEMSAALEIETLDLFII